MTCSNCTTINPDGNRYCGQCGKTLSSSAEDFRQQILQVVREEFKSQDMVAIAIADKAEDRLWRLGKVLGLAGSLAAIGLTVFGLTSFEKAKTQISAAADLATSNLSQHAAATIARLDKQEANSNLLISDLISRTKAGTANLDAAEAALKGIQAKERILAALQKEHPETPIGKIDPRLFSGGGYGNMYAGGYGNMYGGGFYPGMGMGSGKSAQDAVAQLYQEASDQMAADAKDKVDSAGVPGAVSVYKMGSVGDGVGLLQRRLAQLGCYQGVSNSKYDDPTAQAVIAFSKSSSPYSAAPNPKDESFVRQYSPTAKSATPGQVDHDLWQKIFSINTAKCR